MENFSLTDFSAPDSTLPSLLVLSGSRGYGTQHVDSDYDYRGVYVAPTQTFLGLHATAEHHQNGVGGDVTIFEVGKFLRLALKANPNILEILYNPTPLHSDNFGDMIRAERDKMIGARNVRAAYGGFSLGQKKQGERHSGKRLQKHRLHSLRVLEAGIVLLETGILPVIVPNADDLRTRCAQPTEVFEQDIEHLLKKLDTVSTILPEEPSYDAINKLLIRIRLDKLNET